MVLNKIPVIAVDEKGYAVQNADMTHWGKDVLQRLRKERGYSSPEKFAGALGKTISWLAKHEAKQSFADRPEMSTDLLFRAAKLLNVSPEELKGVSIPSAVIDRVRQIEKHGASEEWAAMGRRSVGAIIDEDIPILATSPAGTMSKAKQLGKIIGTIPRGLYPGDPTAFGMVVSGDSMSPWVNHGDVVVASKSLQMIEGIPCVICQRADMNEHCDTIKYVTMDGERLKLVAENRAYHPQWCDPTQVWCYPIVVRVFRDYIRMNLPHLRTGDVQVPPTGEEPQSHPDYDGPQQ